tara:strand:+ start:1323 stop:1715 length:393 start_codon:yes stop_codon:yes gene_type:complete
MAEPQTKTMLQKVIEKIAIMECGAQTGQLRLTAGDFVGKKMLFLSYVNEKTKEEVTYVPLAMMLTQQLLDHCEPDFTMDVDIARRVCLDTLRETSSPAQWTPQWLLENLKPTQDMEDLAALLDKKWAGAA